MDKLPKDVRVIKALKEARRAIKQKMFSYIAAGLSLVAGLAWNDAIKFTIDNLVPSVGNTIIAKVIYAVIITIIVGFLLFYIEKSLEHNQP